MTDIRIPALIDKQAAQHLEEYGCWNEWNEVGSLVGFIVLTIREAGLEAELRENEDSILGRDVCFADIRVWPTRDSDWYWNVYVCLTTGKPVKYWVSARSKYDSDRSASLGIVGRLSAVLAIVCSGLSFTLPVTGEPIMHYTVRQAGAVVQTTDINLGLLIEGEIKAHSKQDVLGYLADTLSSMEIETKLRYQYVVVCKEDSSYLITPMDNSDGEHLLGIEHQVIGGAANITSLGTVNYIAAVVAVVCGGVTFYDDVSDKVIPLTEEDAKVFAHLIEETTPLDEGAPPFISLNEEDSQAFVDALENPPPPNEALLEAAGGHYKDTLPVNP